MVTVAVTHDCTVDEARELTLRLRQSLQVSWDALVEAYQRRAWAALGYESWDAYTDAELGETRFRLPREERREVVASMAEAGMSTRAISSALGVHQSTVVRDRTSGDAFASPDVEVVDAELVDEDVDRRTGEVLGLDGKNYSPGQSTVRSGSADGGRRVPLADTFFEATCALIKSVERIQRLAEDDRFDQNATRIAERNRPEIARSVAALADFLDSLPVPNTQARS